MRNRDRFLASAAEVAAPVFRFNNWKWRSPNGAMMVPTEVDIALRLRRLLDRVIEGEDVTYASSGRLVVDRVDDSGDGSEFVVSIEIATTILD